MTVPARVVHVVAKTHLDLGFTGLASEVVERYVDDFFPRAAAVAEGLRQQGRPERLVWTTGSWILHHALQAGPPEGRRRLAAAVVAGDLAWHALPLTTHTELMDATLVRSGIGISAELDARFGRTTTAAKLTDVPGHTRSLVPLLAAAGVTFLHVGVNPAWPVPDVPPVFRWRSPDGAEVVVAYQAGGYGGEVRLPGCDEVLAFLHTGDNLGPPTVDDVLGAHDSLRRMHPGAEVRGSTLDAFARAVAASGAASRLPVVTAEIGDPWLFGAASDPQKVSAYRALLRRRASFAVDADGPGGVPGVSGGPDEVAGAAGAAGPAERWAEVDRRLLLVAEHTWGLDQKEALPDREHWDRAGLAELRETEAGRRFESSWAEQRDYVDEAARLVADLVHPSVARVDRAGASPAPPASVAPVATTVAQHARNVPPWIVGPGGGPVEAGGHWEPIAPGRRLRWSTGAGAEGWELGVDPVTGAVDHLVDLGSGRVLAGPDHPLGLVTYQSFDEADYERFYAGLSPTAADEWWARLDNTKPGSDAAGAVSGKWTTTVEGAWHTTVPGCHRELVARLAFPAEVSGRLGAPATLWLSIRTSPPPPPPPSPPQQQPPQQQPPQQQQPPPPPANPRTGRSAGGTGHRFPARFGGVASGAALEITLWWDDKPANRLPEALWCSFVPVVAEPERWLMDKLGQPVSPLDVVRHGGRSLHGVGDGGVSYDGPDGSLVIRTLDAPLVAPGRPNLLDADPPGPDLAGGWHVLLHDNCWGTNFAMWNEGPARFRFAITTT